MLLGFGLDILKQNARLYAQRALFFVIPKDLVHIALSESITPLGMLVVPLVYICIRQPSPLRSAELISSFGYARAPGVSRVIFVDIVYDDNFALTGYAVL